MGTVTVVNVKGIRPTTGCKPGGIIYVGRPFGGWPASILGNPYREKIYGREKAIALYKDWFKQKMLDKSSPQRALVQQLCARVDAGEDVVLGCWCAPLDCHASVIKSCIEKTLAIKHGKEEK